MKQEVVCLHCQKTFEFNTSEDDLMGNLCECTHCGTAFKWDGKTLQLLHTPDVPPAPSAVSESASESAPEPALEPTPEAPAPEPISESEATPTPASVPEPEPTPEAPEPEAPAPVAPEPAPPVAEVEPTSSQTLASDISSEADMSEANIKVKSQDFKDVEQYGNATLPSHGPWFYDVVITGIDSKDVENKILLILNDPKLKYSAKECKKELQSGILSVKTLNPVKAVFLISQLINLPVEVRWKQYMLAQT